MNPITGVLNIHPAYCSVLIVFDPLKTDHEIVLTQATKRLDSRAANSREKPRLLELPVCYGGEYGPDLDTLAEQLGLTPERIIALHSGAEYIAYFVGFVPGFAYLGGLPKEIEAPRLASPRQEVPRGSVGIAGAQTGVYPFETPGGWRLIGRTPLAMFEAGRNPMSLIGLGDLVKFIPITPQEYLERAR